MNDVFFFVAISTLLTIVNPLGAMAPFLAMTATESKERRQRTAIRATGVAAGILALCAAAGSFVFNFYGITLPALKVAGGILLFGVAFDMINARAPRSKGTKEEHEEGSQKEDVAVFPLAIPLLSGPGSIVSVFMLSDQATTVLKQFSLYMAILITLGISYLVLLQAHRIVGVLGQIGLNVLTRLMGLILAAIAIQFTIDGIRAALPGLS